MIIIIFISVWVLMGIANIFIYKEPIEAGVKDMSWYYSSDFIKQFFIILLLLFAPFFFFRGISGLIREYFVCRNAEKVLRGVCKESGIDYDEMVERVKNKIKNGEIE